MSATSLPLAERLRLGFVGLGWIGRKRLDAIAKDPSLEVVALYDLATEKLDDAARAYSTAARARSVDELLSFGLDGVVIATPNGEHAQQVMRCLRSDVAVFCQKPLATTARDVRRVIEAARTADRLLGVDFCYRYVNGMDELRRRIQAGALGEITAIDLTFHNAYGPDKQWCFNRAAAGGGCLLDLGVHLLDLASWLQNAPDMQLAQTRRFAQGRAALADEIEDQAYAELRQANGAIIRLACSWYAQIGADAVIQARILGTKGGALWRNVAGSFYDFELALCRGTQREMLARGPDEWGPRALQRWMCRLAAGGRFDPTALDIARNAELIEAMYAT